MAMVTKMAMGMPATRAMATATRVAGKQRVQQWQ